MAIATTIDLENQLTTFRAEGALSLDEIREAISVYYQGDVTRLVLWDLRSASLNNLTSQDVQSLAQFLEKHGSVRQGGLTALVANEDAEFGILRMGEAYADGVPFTLGVFRSIDQAREWLTKDIDE